MMRQSSRTASHTKHKTHFTSTTPSATSQAIVVLMSRSCGADGLVMIVRTTPYSSRQRVCSMSLSCCRTYACTRYDGQQATLYSKQLLKLNTMGIAMFLWATLAFAPS